MHSISPYTIRSYDPQSTEPKTEDRYSVLGKVGQFDAYNVLKSYISSILGTYKVIRDSQQIFRFHDIHFDDAKRQFHGWFQAGSYGLKSEIVNVQTGNIDYHKLQDNAEIINHYIRFFVPAQFNEGIALLHGYKNVGIKTLLHGVLAKAFSNDTGRVLQMHPLAYEKAFVEWQRAIAKEIKLVRYTGLANLEDKLTALGHKEQDLVIRAGKRRDLGKLIDFFTAGSDRSQAVEVLSPLCDHIKTTVELGGRKRTFRIGANPTNQVCEIELDEKEVPVVAGNPNPNSMHVWCGKLLQEFADTVYPGMGVKV